MENTLSDLNSQKFEEDKKEDAVKDEKAEIMEVEEKPVEVDLIVAKQDEEKKEDKNRTKICSASATRKASAKAIDFALYTLFF